MDHELIKTVIFDQHEIIRAAEIVPRTYVFEKNANYVLTGMRRAGKSTLLYGIAKRLVEEGAAWEQIIYINFEDERLSEMQYSDLNDILMVQGELSEQKGYFFFDEIQNVEKWEKFVRRLADAKERVYVTGSNAKMLSREIASTLGGRFLTKTVYPFSFREYLSANNIPFDQKSVRSTKGMSKIRRYYGTYLREGGFPELLSYEVKRVYLESVYQKVLFGDIIARNRVRNPQAVRILLKKIAETVSTDVSYSRLHNMLVATGLRTSKDAVIEYVTHAEDAFLILRLNNYFARFAEKECIPKYYFRDNGLLRLFLSENDTALLENQIALSLVRRYGDNVFFLKSSKTGIDIDFYLPSVKTLIQVAWSLKGAAYDREVKNMLKAQAHLEEIEHCYIITCEEEESIHIEGAGIRVLPAFRFLLDRDRMMEAYGTRTEKQQ